MAETADWEELLVWSKEPLILAIYFAMYASGVANAFLYSFVPSLFVEAYGAQVSDLAWLTAAAPLCNSVCCVLSGLLADRLATSWPTHRCRMLMQSASQCSKLPCTLCVLCSSAQRRHFLNHNRNHAKIIAVSYACTPPPAQRTALIVSLKHSVGS